jgi:hypothetical protein
MQISNLKRFILFDFKFQKQKHLQLFIQCLYFILQNSLVLKSKLKYKSITTQSVFFDMLFPLQQLNFLKMGGNLDSLIKTQAVIVYTKILTNVLFIFDKYSVVYLIKKTTENS